MRPLRQGKTLGAAAAPLSRRRAPMRIAQGGGDLGQAAQRYAATLPNT